MKQLDINFYPESPEYVFDTSRAAKKMLTPRIGTIRWDVYGQFQLGAFTADEIADILGLTVLTVRPRVTELLKGGFIIDTGIRRMNESGCLAKVFTAKKENRNA